ncbi:hypothetical protein QQX98_012489 [Neonectria punicea]|uniref:Glycoside hydrolase family 43 protein n=1 Tax=Neonectria punicea TaxID=979145 RepID=A0ABR1GIR3_9HYPO
MKFSSIASGIIAAWSLLGSAAAFTNPIRNPGGSDPFVTRSGDGYYYLMSTSWTNLEIARSTTIAGLKTATRKVIYTSTTSNRCCNVWAPEIHWMGDRWYVYFTAGNKDNLDGQRMHVLKGGVSAWDDAYTYAGQLNDVWAIDASVLRFSAYGNYLMFSCMYGVTYQSICLQKLNDDHVSLSGSISIISQPDQTWEKHSHPVNEGPAALYAGGKTMISYSASYCWSPNYCLGLLTWDGKTNPTQASAWTKSSGCLLSSGSGHYGTGHNSFFQGPSGNEWWIAYHATSTSTGACDDSRYAMIQKITVGSDGAVSFGKPASSSTNIAEPV